MIAVLNDIRSSHNVGSIFRTADACGFSKIYLCGYTPAPLDKFGFDNNKLKKVSLGAEDFLEWEKVDSIIDLIVKLKSQGKRIYSVEQSKKSILYTQADKQNKENIVFIMGNEVTGLSEDILEMSDNVLEIPMYGEKSSLNVAVAFGVVGYALAN